MALLAGRNAVLGEMLDWWSDLEPIEASVYAPAVRNGNLQKYRCLRFTRGSDGDGFCSQYESRPVPCATFPNGAPVHAAGFEACSWNVTIIEDSELGPESQ